MFGPCHLRWHVLVLALSATGCSAGEPPEGEFQCFDDPRCPEGRTCLAGVCVAEGTIAPPCATVDQLATSFDQMPPGTVLETKMGGVAGIGQGSLNLETPSAERFAYTRLRWLAARDLRDRPLIVEVPAIGGSATELVLDDLSTFDVDKRGAYVGVHGGGDTIEVYAHENPVDARPYQPVNHRWWRVSAQGASLVYDTSPNGENWSRLTSHPTTLALDFVLVSIRAAHHNQAIGGIAKIASVNDGRDASQPFCKTDTIQDSFDDGRAAPLWRSMSSGCTTSEGGKLAFAVAGDTAAVCRYATTRPFDLRGVWLTAKVVPANTPGITRLELASDDAADVITMEKFPAGLRLAARNDGASLLDRTVPYRADVHRYWRVGLGPDGRLHFAASRDGEDFADLAAIDAPSFDGSALTLDLSLRLAEPSASAVTAAFEAFR